MRRFGQPPQPGIYHKKRPGAYVILPCRSGILLTLQTYPQSAYPAELQLPGGGIDPGETPLQALNREVIEETGWRIGGVRRLGAYKRFVYMAEYDLFAEKICHIYIARPIRQVSAPSEPGHEAVILPFGAALEGLESRGDAAFLRAHYGRIARRF